MRLEGANATPATTTTEPVARFLSAEEALMQRYGIAVSERFLNLPSLQLNVRVLETGDGPPTLLLPGLGAVAAVWAPLLAGLGSMRAIAMDRPGCGLSDGFDLRGADLRGWAVGLVSSLVDALELKRVNVIGNSIGGTMALWYAIAHPERVNRLVTIGAPPFVLDVQAPLGMRVMSIPFIARKALSRSTPGDAERRFVSMGHRPSALTPELLELVMAARGLHDYADGFAGVLHGATGLMGRRVAVHSVELAALACPTLLIWGSNDTHGPVVTGRRMVATMPNAHLEVCGQGHLPWLDEPARCATLTREFLLGD